MTIENLPLSYKAADAAALSGLTFRQIDYWDRTNLLTPSVASAGGSGSRRRYSLADILRARALRVIGELFGQASARALADNIEEAKPSDLTGKVELKVSDNPTATLLLDLSIDEVHESQLWRAVCALAVKP